ncbi:MAG: hypothetical protein GF375_05745 [Candidatus Omnitrophica bacterium]|nr:hypothetical protein [Candidatus Omnitrophota bacterium]
MKKRLLKPPREDSAIFLEPSLSHILNRLKSVRSAGTAHQLDFFNPGVAAKFLLLDYLPHPLKKIIFVDTDKVSLSIRMLSSKGSLYLDFVRSEEPLENIFLDDRGKAADFFARLHERLMSYPFEEKGEIMDNFLKYKEIFMRNCRKKFLKEILAESLLEFYGLETDYYFLSELLKSKKYDEFVLRIYREGFTFREVFNTALDEYKKTFRFRYKNYPFAHLKEGELPFWIVKEKKRLPCFRKDMDSSSSKGVKIYPRAFTLTLFLRLYYTDFFIHGIGGGNYEWVQDRLIERFFKSTPLLYAVVSGTYYLKGYDKRDYPFFLYSPAKLTKSFSSNLNALR